MSEKGDTLIILSPGFPANEAESTCLPAQQQFVRSLNSCFPLLHIIILTFHYPFTKASYQWHGNTVIPFNGRNKGKLNRLVLWVKVWKVLEKLKRKNRIMGLFSFWCAESALVGKYFGQYYTIPHLIWICGQDARRQNWLIKLIRPQPRSLIAMSDFLADEFYRNHHIRPQHVVYNGIELSRFKLPNTQRRDIDIMGIGSLIPLKQYEILITIVQQLRQKNPAIQAVICGQGPELEKLQGLIIQFDLQQNITLQGERPHEEILLLLQRTKILLHPSNYEGFSGVCLEALYAGAQVISFCKPVNRPVTHWYIAQDVTAMFQKALAILDDPTVDHSPVLVNDMKTSVMAVMQLFGYRDAAIS